MGIITASPVSVGNGAGRAASVDAAFQGAPGAFSEAAALELLGPGALLLPCTRFEDVFGAVASGRVACGIVPVENTLAGTVHPVIDLLLASDLVIVAETVLRISHALIGTPDATIDGLKRVLSHPVALQQCTAFFAAHSGIEAVPVFDTAGAVEMVMRAGDPSDAAIAGARTATVYGGRVLAEDLEDDPANFTRFVKVARRGACRTLDVEVPYGAPRVRSGFDWGRRAVAPSIAEIHAGTERLPQSNPERRRGAPSVEGDIKTTIVFTVVNRPGALLDCLAPFADRGIDLRKLESRPLRGSPFEYAFLVDFVGDAGTSDVGAALTELGQHTRTVRVLGSYPSATATQTRDATG